MVDFLGAGTKRKKKKNKKKKKKKGITLHVRYITMKSFNAFYFQNYNQWFWSSVLYALHVQRYQTAIFSFILSLRIESLISIYLSVYFES